MNLYCQSMRHNSHCIREYFSLTFPFKSRAGRIEITLKSLIHNSIFLSESLDFRPISSQKHKTGMSQLKHSRLKYNVLRL